MDDFGLPSWLPDPYDPAPFLNHLLGRRMVRKPRLFACVSVPPDYLRGLNASAQEAVRVAERYADGRATPGELYAAYRAAGRDTRRDDPNGHDRLCWRPVYAAGPDSYRCTREVLSDGEGGEPASGFGGAYGSPHYHYYLIRVLTDLLGPLPFRPVAFDPAWRTTTALALANSIYERKAFDHFPILADALQDAGCNNDDILTHLRGDGPHCRGCWPLDLILGKE